MFISTSYPNELLWIWSQYMIAYGEMVISGLSLGYMEVNWTEAGIKTAPCHKIFHDTYRMMAENLDTINKQRENQSWRFNVIVL